MTMSSVRHKPLFDVHPVTGASFEVFYSDRTLESFGWSGAGWYWWPRRRGFAPSSPAKGPFPTSYSAYRDALHSAQGSCKSIFFGVGLQSGCNKDWA
jgi:hypothetical protein